MAEIIKKEKIRVENGTLRKLCKKYNTTTVKLAEVSGVSEVLLYKFDRGHKTITLDVWDKICKHLKTVNKFDTNFKDWKKNNK